MVENLKVLAIILPMEYILGVAVSLLVQWLKVKMNTDTWTTMLAVLMFSFVGAAGYVLLSHTDFWPVIVQILTVAGAFYAYILQRFETS